MKRGALTDSVRLVIFDLDGTLIDSKYDIAASVNLTLGDLDLPTLSTERIFTFVGDGVKRLLRLSVGEANEARYEEALRIFRGHYLAHCLDTTQLYPGLDQLFDGHDTRMKALATNKSLEYTLHITEGLKVKDLFAAIEGPRDQSDLKPDPGMLLRILDRLSVRPEEAVLVGDSTNDVRAAQAAGVSACAVGYGYGNRDKVSALNPDYYCEKPNDLLSLLFG
ncbi:MAG: HAD-IA family hydrolase [Nitrospira sp. SB0675_bin_23]|nr:HAD-IA family hydrolase [Nitrospira sp. SB0675_bin_23]